MSENAASWTKKSLDQDRKQLNWQHCFSFPLPSTARPDVRPVSVKVRLGAYATVGRGIETHVLQVSHWACVRGENFLARDTGLEWHPGYRSSLPMYLKVPVYRWSRAEWMNKINGGLWVDCPGCDVVRKSPRVRILLINAPLVVRLS